MRRPGRALVFLCALAVLLPVSPVSILSAQETVNYASISGRVTDASGAVLAGAEVSVRHLETNVASKVVADQEGRYRFPYLHVGPYELAISAKGFATTTRRLTLTVGAAFDVPVSLAVGPVEATISVTSEAPTLEAARSQIAGTISQVEVNSLPLNGRSFLDLALLIP